MENISLIGLDLRSSVKKVGVAQREALSKEMDELLLGPTLASTGTTIVELHQKASGALSSEYGAGLAAILAKVPTEKINLSGYSKWADDLLRKEAGTQKVGKAPDTNDFKSKVNSLLKNNRKVVSFQDVSVQLQKIGDVARQARLAGDSAGAKYAGDAYAQLEGVMESAALKLGSNYAGEMKALNKWFKETKGVLDSDVMHKAVKKDASLVGSFLYKTPESVASFKGFLTEAIKRGDIGKKEAVSVMNDIRKGYVNELIPSGTTINEIYALSKKLRSKGNKENASAILGAPQYNRLMGVLETAEIVAKQLGDGNARFSLVAQAATSGAYKDIARVIPLAASTGAVGASLLTLPVALGIVITPAILGKIAASPAKAVEWRALTTFMINANRTANSKTTKVALSRYMNFMDSIQDTKEEARVNRALTQKKRGQQ